MHNFNDFLISFIKRRQFKFQSTIFSTPVSNNSSYSEKIGIEKRFPIYFGSDFDSDYTKKASNLAFNIGKDAAIEFFDLIKDFVYVDISGHSGVYGEHSLSDFSSFGSMDNNTAWMTKESIINQLAHSFSKSIYNIPQGDDLTDSQLKYILEIFQCPETGLFILFNRDSIIECSGCGRPLKVLLDTNTMKAKLFTSTAFDMSNNMLVSIIPNKCQEKESVYSGKININSGKIVFANDMRHIVKNNIPLNKHMTKKMGFTSSSSDSITYKRLESKYYSDLNIFFISTTNAGLNIYKSNSGILLKNDFCFDDEGNEKDSILPGETSYGHISMDRWIMMGMDYDLFCLLSKASGYDPYDLINKLSAIVVDVDPGDYDFNCLYEKTKNDPLVTYAEIKKSH